MRIQGSSVSVKYNKIDGIKKIYYNNESVLKDYFNEATILPVPDDAPVEIPRIIIKTLNEHAQLNISLTAATFDVQYDCGFEYNWRNCAEYIKARMEKVLEFLNLLTNNHYEYIGIVTNIIYDEIPQDGEKQLSSILLHTEEIDEVFDVNIRYSFVEENRFFTNIQLQNARVFKTGVSKDIAGGLNEKNQELNSIGAIIDINDRYGFNCFNDYNSDSTVLDDLLEKMGNVIENKLQLLIEEGIYHNGNQE